MKVKGYRGSVSLDGKMVTVRKTLRGAVTIAVEDIRSVEIGRAGIGLSAIRFAVAGGSLHNGQRVLGSTLNAMRDPYALAFRKGRTGVFEELQRAVLAARH